MSPDAILDEVALCAARSHKATEAGALAFARLLSLADQRDAGQIPRIAHFLAATYNGRRLDALRWARADLHTPVPDGDARLRAVIKRWGLQWPVRT